MKTNSGYMRRIRHHYLVICDAFTIIALAKTQTRRYRHRHIHVHNYYLGSSTQLEDAQTQRYRHKHRHRHGRRHRRRYRHRHRHRHKNLPKKKLGHASQIRRNFDFGRQGDTAPCHRLSLGQVSSQPVQLKPGIVTVTRRAIQVNSEQVRELNNKQTEPQH